MEYPEQVEEPYQFEGHWRALRLVRPNWVKPSEGGLRPMSAAFQDRDESRAMSVFLEEQILRAGRTVEELLAEFPGSYLCLFTISTLQDDFKQIVTIDPVPTFPGHALVRDQSGKRTQGTRSRMAKVAVWHELGQPSEVE